MKEYFHELNSEQWISEDLSWNCTCLWGTVGRYKSDSDKPCICLICALNKWSYRRMKEREQSTGKEKPK